MTCTWIPVATGLCCLAAMSIGPSAQSPYAAYGEANPIRSAVSGTYSDTHAADDRAVQSITEAMTSGQPAARTHRLEHLWFFEVAAHASATLRVRAARDGAESFTFSWSVDAGQTWQSAYVLTHDVLPRIPDSVELPASATGGTLWLRVEDDDRSAADDAPDTVTVDYLAVALGPDQWPTTPTGLRAVGSGPHRIDLQWDRGTGDAEWYRVERGEGVLGLRTVAILGPSTTSFVDEVVVRNTSEYRVVAYNRVGQSAPTAWVSARKPGDDAFMVEFVDASPAPRSIALATDPSAEPGVLLGDEQGALRLAEERSADWSIDDLPNGALDASFAYQADGQPAFAYVAAGVCYASLDPELGLRDKCVDRQGHGPTALAIDAQSGEVFLAYVRDDHGRSAAQEIWLAHRSRNGKWSRQEVDRGTVAAALALAVDPDGRPGLAYADGGGATSDTLKYAHWNGASWDVAVVESGAAGHGLGARLAYDPLTAEPRIVHGGGRLALRDGAAWQVAVLPDPVRPDVGLAIGATGVVHVAYVESATGELCLRQWAGSAWSESTPIDTEVESGVPGFLIDPRTQEALLAYRGRRFGEPGLKVARKYLDSASSFQRHIAYPQEHLHSSSGESTPLGWGPESVDEARTQELLPARFLPPVPGEIVALEVAVSPNFASTRKRVVYADLRISLGHADESRWTDRFADNLSDPLLVYRRQNHGIEYHSGWTRLTFDRPFRYDGHSGVGIDIQKAVDPVANWRYEGTFSYQMLRWYPDRRDLPPQLGASGQAGSGAADAATGRLRGVGLMYRLVFHHAATMTVDAPHGARIPDVSGLHSFCRGCPVTFTTHAREGDAWFGFFGTQLRQTPLEWPRIAGRSWLGDGVLAWSGTIAADGRGSAQLTVPDSAALVGLHIYAQSAVAGRGITWTNLVDGILAE